MSRTETFGSGLPLPPLQQWGRTPSGLPVIPLGMETPTSLFPPLVEVVSAAPVS